VDDVRAAVKTVQEIGTVNVQELTSGWTDSFKILNTQGSFRVRARVGKVS